MLTVSAVWRGDTLDWTGRGCGKEEFQAFLGHSAHDHITHPRGTKAAPDNKQANAGGSVPTPHFLWALKCEFHVIFTCLLGFFSNHLNHETAWCEGCTRTGGRSELTHTDPRP